MSNPAPDKPLVLVVDDDEIDRERVRRLIGDDFRLSAAESGSEALERLADCTPACVLLDFRLPDVDGWALLDQLAAQFPVILLTGRDETKLAVEAMRRGAEDFLCKKDLEQNEFHRVLSRTIETGRLRQELQFQQRELDRHHALLEEIVSERTAELTQVIAELNEREKRISLQNTELARASLLKSEFLATMSHELRTPLNGIIGFSDLMLAGLVGDLNAKQADYVEEIGTCGRYLLSLINDILDLSKIEAGKTEIEYVKTDPKEVGKSALVIVRERANAENIALSHEVEEDLKPFFVDQRKLKQVLYNLLSNAVKFTPEGGEVSLKASLESPDSISFMVEDNGIGISEKNQMSAFLPFVQLHQFATREHKGTGLGLSLCKELVELMGGRIHLTSALGQGCQFKVVLPYRDTIPEEKR